MIYLDYSATTPVDKEVLDTYIKVTNEFIGNANSIHKLGMNSNKLITISTEKIKELLKLKDMDVIYTSGATESNNMVIKGVVNKYKNRGKHIITTELEHSSILEPLEKLKQEGYKIDYVKLDKEGQVDIEDLKKLMTEDTILVTIAKVSSELGIVQDLEKISEVVRKYPKCFFHSDLTQAIGKTEVDINILDFASTSTQKIYGPKGIGLLLKKKNIIIDQLIDGGKSTTSYRSGTPATPLIAATAKAIRLSLDNMKHINEIKNLNKYLLDNIKDLNIDINSTSKSIPHILNFSLRNIKSETMLHVLEEKEIYVSTTTACSKGSFSLPVYALTSDVDRASRSIRVSISHLTTKEELDIFIKELKLAINKLTLRN